MAGSWRPRAWAGAVWVDVRPLRRPAHTPRGTNPATPCPSNPYPAGSSSLPIIGRRSPASSSFVLAPRPNGALRLRALQLDPRPRGGTKPGTCEESQQNSPTPARQPQQVTGPDHHAPLTESSPMGGCSVPLGRGDLVSDMPLILGDL